MPPPATTPWFGGWSRSGVTLASHLPPRFLAVQILEANRDDIPSPLLAPAAGVTRALHPWENRGCEVTQLQATLGVPWGCLTCSSRGKTSL